jgi:D-arabinose 1-dehydrogenase-like Zn-dependent alcohol dehydrogenase
MKAAVVQEFGKPLVIEDRLIPEPGPGQVTARMEASGLCHTDIHAANGDWPVKPKPPFGALNGMRGASLGAVQPVSEAAWSGT